MLYRCVARSRWQNVAVLATNMQGQHQENVVIDPTTGASLNYGILFPTPCAGCPISFANEFYQMALVGPLIRCLYYSDAPVFGSMTTFA